MTSGNESLHQDSNDKGVRKISIATAKRSSFLEQNLPELKHA